MHPALPASAMHSNGIPITQTLQIYKKVFETTIVFEKKCIDIQSMSKKYQVVYLEGIGFIVSLQCHYEQWLSG